MEVTATTETAELVTADQPERLELAGDVTIEKQEFSQSVADFRKVGCMATSCAGCRWHAMCPEHQARVEINGKEDGVRPVIGLGEELNIQYGVKDFSSKNQFQFEQELSLVTKPSKMSETAVKPVEKTYRDELFDDSINIVIVKSQKHSTRTSPEPQANSSIERHRVEDNGGTSGSLINQYSSIDIERAEQPKPKAVVASVAVLQKSSQFKVESEVKQVKPKIKQTNKIRTISHKLQKSPAQSPELVSVHLPETLVNDTPLIKLDYTTDKFQILSLMPIEKEESVGTTKIQPKLNLDVFHFESKELLKPKRVKQISHIMSYLLNSNIIANSEKIVGQSVSLDKPKAKSRQPVKNNLVQIKKRLEIKKTKNEKIITDINITNNQLQEEPGIKTKDAIENLATDSLEKKRPATNNETTPADVSDELGLTSEGSVTNEKTEKRSTAESLVGESDNNTDKTDSLPLSYYLANNFSDQDDFSLTYAYQTSDKTTLLKTVGLARLLADCALFVF